jgi:SWI/SNF-related matrix-associated actin-dependent regulator of chromatin subfamily A containing DEAD/H box 1
LLEFMMPDIFATGDVDLKKLLNAEDHELISRINRSYLKSDVMQQLVPKIQHVSGFILSHLRLVVLLGVSTYFYHKYLQVKFVIMNSEQCKAYKNTIDEYHAACQARNAKSSVDISSNVLGLIPKHQISNYFMQFRMVS